MTPQDAAWRTSLLRQRQWSLKKYKKMPEELVTSHVVWFLKIKKNHLWFCFSQLVLPVPVFTTMHSALVLITCLVYLLKGAILVDGIVLMWVECIVSCIGAWQTFRFPSRGKPQTSREYWLYKKAVKPIVWQRELIFKQRILGTEPLWLGTSKTCLPLIWSIQ